MKNKRERKKKIKKKQGCLNYLPVSRRQSSNCKCLTAGVWRGGCSHLWARRKVWLFTSVDETYPSSLRPSAAPTAPQFADSDFLPFLSEIQKAEALRQL